MKNQNDSGKVIGALLVGAAIGGALGILFAPAKGSKTRRKIVDGSDELTDSMKAKMNNLLVKVKNDVQLAKDKATEFMDDEKALNSKILKITMKIKDQYPELSKYLEEMQVTIPDEKTPEITLKNLRLYYESLNSLLNKYILEHSSKIKI